MGNVGTSKQGARAGGRDGGPALRGTNSSTQWSVATELTHLQRRVADLAAELQVGAAAVSATLQVLSLNLEYCHFGPGTLFRKCFQVHCNKCGEWMVQALLLWLKGLAVEAVAEHSCVMCRSSRR